MNMNIRDLIEVQPFEGVDSDYKPVDDVLNADIRIIATKFFENDKGEGAYVLCDDGVETFHICTHSIGLVGILKNEKVQEMLAQGTPLDARIVKRKSTKSDRMVYTFA